MADREKIIRYYKGTEGAEAAIKLVDMAEQVTRSRKFRLADFLDPYGCEIAETVAANYPVIKVSFDGGYVGAERQRAILIHEDFMGTPLFNIVAVEAAWNEQFYHISHRDVLGALMGLGIKREQIGDLLIMGSAVKILTDEKMASFILANCTQIGAASVHCKMAELNSIVPREERSKEIRATVASLRVDSVAAAGFGSSRSKAVADISADKLKLNWQTVKNVSQMVKEGDIISMRGRGRVEVTEVRGQTKKGRIGILLTRYL
ncbi:MAG: YlmH/Sll1252 family protein [Selenomonadaceae bacterium]